MNNIVKLTFCFLVVFFFQCKKDNSSIIDIELTQEQHQRAEGFHDKAIHEYGNNHIKEALINIDKAIEISHSKNSYSFKMILLFGKKDYKELLKTTNEALLYKENQYPESYQWNGLAYELNNQSKKAKIEYQKALTIWENRKDEQQNYPEILTQKPVLIAILRSKEEALKEFDFLIGKLYNEDESTLFEKEYRTTLEKYDGTGMSFFMNL